MRIIVFDREMAEPLTIVEIPASAMREIENGRRYWIMPVPVTMRSWMTLDDKTPWALETLPTVALRFEPIMKHEHGEGRVLYWIATPDNEELSLLLRAAFLPGQLTEVRRREMQRWFQGALGAPPPDSR